MNPHKKHTEEEAPAGFALDDIYYVVFRQKWKIVACTLAGVLVAAAAFILKPAQYQTEAKLLVRYIKEGKTPTSAENQSDTISPDARGENIIGTEVEILTSTDLARQVAAAVGPEKILGRSGLPDETNRAAGLVLRNLTIDTFGRGNVIPIVFQHPDPAVAQAVLGEIITAYLKKHFQMHQPLEGLAKESDQKRTDLDRTETDLRLAKQRAGVTFLDDAKAADQEQISQFNKDIFAAEADLEGHRAALKFKSSGQVPVIKADPTGAVVQFPPDVLKQYGFFSQQVNEWSQRELLSRADYPLTSLYRKPILDHLESARAEKEKLEAQYPGLANIAISSPAPALPPSSPAADTASESLQVAELEARTNQLHRQLDLVRAELSRIEENEGTILALQRRKEEQERSLKSFTERLEQSRLDGQLADGAGSGISIVQSPSAPVKQYSKSFKKKVAMVLAGGLFGGLALAFFIEMVLDRSVRRPGEVAKKLNLPLFISIPRINGNPHRSGEANGAARLQLTGGATGALVPAANGTATGAASATRPSPDSALSRFCAGLRDRLIVNFEVRNLTHNPKLVAVTSCGKGAGVSTIAAGLAASLSQTGVGNVLLVDMNGEQGTAQDFHHGKPGCGLADALETETRGNAQVDGNLYVASESIGDGRLPRVIPRQFASLMPKLKASDYDYIIFDMPAVSQTSMTPRLAGLMDMVLLVIESEKTNRESVQRAGALLAESRANVSAVLNKVRSIVPAGLYQEFLGDA